MWGQLTRIGEKKLPQRHETRRMWIPGTENFSGRWCTQMFQEEDTRNGRKEGTARKPDHEEWKAERKKSKKSKPWKERFR